MGMHTGLVLTRTCDLTKVEDQFTDEQVEEIMDRPEWLFNGIKNAQDYSVTYPGDDDTFVLCNDIDEVDTDWDEGMFKFAANVSKYMTSLNESDVDNFKTAISNIEKHFGMKLDISKISFRREVVGFVR